MSSLPDLSSVLTHPTLTPDLSSVLTNANLTMYPTSAPETLQLLLTNNTYNPTILSPWYDVNPQCWTKEQVLDWMAYNVEGNKFDTSLSMEICSMDGPTLCQMTRDQLVNTFGLLGLQFYQSLQEHKSKYELPPISGTELSETCQLLDFFFMDNNFPEFPFLNSVTVCEGTVARDNFSYNKSMTPHSDDGYDSESLYSSSSSGGIFNSQHPSSPESRSSDSDPEFSLPAIAKHIKTEKAEMKKRGRGRPPKIVREHFFQTPSKKSKHAPRGTHLWEFIRDILIHPEQNPGLMKWEDRREGVFKFIKSEAVAQMWGQKKKNNSMTYEKLSRAMRYYYKREILERVDGRRLVYKFGKNSSGWKAEDTGMKKSIGCKVEDTGIKSSCVWKVEDTMMKNSCGWMLDGIGMGL